MIVGLFTLALLNLVIGLTIYLIQRKNPVQITYLVLSIVFSSWLVIFGLTFMPINSAASLLVSKLFYASSVLLSTALLVFSLVFPAFRTGLRYRNCLFLWVFLMLGIAVFIFSLNPLAASILFNSEFFQYGLVLVISLSMAMTILIWSIKEHGVKDVRLKTQLQIMLAMIITILTLLLFLLVDWQLRGNTNLIVGILVILSAGTMTLLGYTVANQTSYDLRPSLVKMAIWLIELFMGLSLYLTMVVLLERLGPIGPVWLSLIHGLLMVITVGLLSIVHPWLLRTMEKSFYHNQPTGELNDQVYQIGTLELTLKEAMRRLLRVISNHTGASKVTIMLKDSDTSNLASETLMDNKVGSKHLPIARADTKTLDSFLTKHSQDIISVQDLKSQNQELYQMFLGYGIDLLIALRSVNNINGYVILKNPNFGRFNLADIESLSKTKSAILVDLLSAQARDKLAEINSSLEQKIKASTRELEWTNHQLRKLDEVKDEFVAMASHQLRTPLTSIKGYLSLILEGDVGKITASQQQILTEAFRASEKMVHTINDFLNVSRLQTGRFTINKEIIDLKEIVLAEVEAIQETAKDYDLGLTIATDTKMPTKMNLDENKIRQAIGNLLDNAIYYSRPGGKVQTMLVIDKDTIKFTVQDSGIGVPVEERQRLFTKFYRASNGKKRRPDGTGIGLYLVKEVIEGHTGQVFYEPTETGGSSFGFSLPINKRLNPGIFVKTV